MRTTIILSFILPFALFLAEAQAQPKPAAGSAAPWAQSDYAGEGKAKPRPEFISYDTRPLAEAGNPDNAAHYLLLAGPWRINATTTAAGGAGGFSRRGYSTAAWDTEQVPNFSYSRAPHAFESLVPPRLPAENPLVQYRAEIEVPYMWLDRDLYIHIEGVGSGYSLFVNDKRIGYSEDSRTPAEFNISSAVTDGLNSIGIEVYGHTSGSWLETLLPQPLAGTLGKVYIYSQPKLHIEDFVITTRPDVTGKHILADIAVVMANTYNGAEKITLGYDIYSPEGKLLTYNLAETAIGARSSDTLRFREYLYGTLDKIGWTPAAPNLYSVMLFTRRDGRIIEYIPLKLGIRWIDVQDGELRINGKKAQLQAVNYDADADRATTERQLKALKNNKINTVCVSYPQPAWFYQMCDRVGMYVVDQANINAGYRPADRNVGGSPANMPEYLPAFLDRASAMQGRSRNYACVIALSMGGKSGNGYNFYKTYQWLKANDTIHPVTYRDVQGEWNSDFVFPDAGSAASLVESVKRPASAEKAGAVPGKAAPVNTSSGKTTPANASSGRIASANSASPTPNSSSPAPHSTFTPNRR